MRLALLLLGLSVLTACANRPPAGPDSSVVWRQTFQATSDRAASGDAAAERELGMMYIGGNGVPLDYEKGYEWLAKASAGGDFTAAYTLGNAYEYGTGVPEDQVKAQAFYLQAAKQGYPRAESSAGYAYLHGTGTPVDYAQALVWLKKASADGDVAAFENLGYMYGNGLGTPKDDAAAIDCYQHAADLGSRTSQLMLGAAYHQGLDGLQKDEAKSQKYFAMVADRTVTTFADLAYGMREIVDAHKLYPPEAAAARQYGAVTVEFDCPDRVPLNVKVVRSSGFPLLDAAAKQAVEDSYFPDRSPELKAQRRFSVVINFIRSVPAVPAPAPTTVTIASAAATH